MRMDIFKKMKAKKTAKKIEKKMQEIYDYHPFLENFELFLEACFSLWPDMKEAHELSASMLLEYYSMSMGKIYYCEHLADEDWVRLDYVRPMKGILFDLVNRKVTSNGVAADLIILSENKALVDEDYKKAMAEKRKEA